MNRKIPVLDQGYIQFIESWGSDERIIEAARMSTDKGFLGWNPVHKCELCGCEWRDNRDGTISLNGAGQQSCNICEFQSLKDIKLLHSGDEKLLAYLYDHKHATPFEMAGMVIEVKAPIMVFREWHRHRTQSYNEMSARYAPLPDENYLPTIERLMAGANTATSNKQAQGIGTAQLTEEQAMLWLDLLEDVYNHAQQVYETGLSLGIPKELARLPLPVGRYSRMRVSCNLRNWLAFLTLRMDTAAQYEIRVYADEVCKMIGQHFPRTHDLFVR